MLVFDKRLNLQLLLGNNFFEVFEFRGLFFDFRLHLFFLNYQMVKIYLWRLSVYLIVILISLCLNADILPLVPRGIQLWLR